MRSRKPTAAGATTAQLKGDIDRGRTGDKVGGFDPGAAPLGTDEEAGGAVIDPVVVELDRRSQASSGLNSRRANAADPSLAPTGGRSPKRRSIPWIMGLSLVAVMAVAATCAIDAL
jgi:hypothetical protein